MMTNNKDLVDGRNNRIDTIKGIMIFLVIVIHGLALFNGDEMIVSKCIIAVLHSFVMPTFVFVSGYLSSAKKEDIFVYEEKLFVNLLLPFAVFHLLMWLMTSRRLESILEPGWTLWYLLALFFWKIITPLVSRLRGCVLISIVFCLLVGFTPAGKLLTISRFFCFYPVFLLGYKFKGTNFGDNKKSKRILALLVIVAMWISIVMLTVNDIPLHDVFQFSESYQSIGVSGLEGVFLRLLAITFGIITAIMFFFVAPRRKTLFSNLGMHTITVYIAHSFILKAVVKGFSILKIEPGGNAYILILFSLFLSVCICCLFGNKRVHNLYNKLFNKLSSFFISQKI